MIRPACVVQMSDSLDLTSLKENDERICRFMHFNHNIYKYIYKDIRAVQFRGVKSNCYLSDKNSYCDLKFQICCACSKESENNNS